jgi:2-polyprenyl-6-methoxyphenol hydroxylase-like FAD-dependent oxidoreductase
LVAWGGGADAPATVEEPGLAIAAQVLQRLLRQSLKGLSGAPSLQIVETAPTNSAPPADWTVEARGRGAAPAFEILSAGKRVAIVCEVRLSAETDASLATIESLDEGWLFLLPLGGRRAALQAIVPEKPTDHRASLSELLASSHLVTRFVAAIESESRVAACAPQARVATARSGWVAAGDAAVAFDPICGDGTGQAVRSGLLAAAVIEAILRGDREADCLAHYRARLAFAFHTHLTTVASFYQSSRSPRIWQGEVLATAVALESITRQRSNEAPPRYHLERFRLLPASPQGGIPARSS